MRSLRVRVDVDAAADGDCCSATIGWRRAGNHLRDGTVLSYGDSELGVVALLPLGPGLPARGGKGVRTTCRTFVLRRRWTRGGGRAMGGRGSGKVSELFGSSDTWLRARVEARGERVKIASSVVDGALFAHHRVVVERLVLSPRITTHDRLLDVYEVIAARNRPSIATSTLESQHKRWQHIRMIC